MDYPPPQQKNYGIIYNATKPIGGIHYYQEKRGQVKISKVDKPSKAIVEIKPKPNYIYQEQKLISKNNPYIIKIQGKKVDFSKEGIERAQLSSADKDWLEKAQYYFLSAKERNRRIGSAEDFTKIEILEALWATAEAQGVDPKRFLVQIYNESRFNPYAKGKAGERGIGQFKKMTAKYYGYDWSKITDGIDGFAYQAKVAANFVHQVGEIAYNGKGKRAELYKDKISSRLARIARS